METTRDLATALDQLKAVRSSLADEHTLDELRGLFDRVQSIRRTFAGDFDLQLAAADLQETIIDRARWLRGETMPPAQPAEQSKAVDPGPVEDEEVQPVAPTDAVELDAKSWQRAIYVGAFFAILLFAAFFYLIQMARRINIDHPIANASQPAPAPVPVPAPSKPMPDESAVKPVSNTPTLRLYTDVIPGKVSVDGKAPVDLQDGELTLENLTAGKHSINLLGANGKASFDYTVETMKAPQLAATPTADNAMLVVVSTQDGKGKLVTNAIPSQVVLDGKTIGDVEETGIQLTDLGVTDHDLQIKRTRDQQRFILTYTVAPAMTVFIKSDPDAGSLLIIAGQDDAQVFVNDKPYKRMTEHGQLRIPNLKVGEYIIRVHKPGFVDAAPTVIHIIKGEESRAEFQLTPVPQVATLEVRGAQPGTTVFLDRDLLATVGGDGIVTLPGIKAGEHIIELRHEGSVPRRLQRSFATGATVSLSGNDVALERLVANEKPAAVPVPEQKAAPAASVPQSTEKETTLLSGERVQHGGGFVIYHATGSSGRYNFSAQLRKGGGFLKKERLQWFAGYQDPKNYILFQIDGKHLIIREVSDGKGTDMRRVPFDVDPNDWIQVEMSVHPNGIDTKVRSANGAWHDAGSIPVEGRDMTQGKVGFLVPGNDEISVSNFRYSR